MLLPFKKITTAAAGTEAVKDFDFKKSYPKVNQNTSWADLEPHIRQSVRSYILPFLGKKLYDDICTKIHTPPVGGFSDAQQILIEYLKDVAAHYAIVAALLKGKTTVASMGVVENAGSDGTTTTSQWGFRVTLWAAAQDADRMMDELLAHLEAQVDKTSPDTYFVDNWKSEPAYNELSAGFFRQTSEFQKHHNIGRSLRTFKSLVPTMDECAEHRILPILGQEQFDALLLAVRDNSTATATVSLLQKVRKALAKWTIYEAAVGMPIVVENEGFRVVSNSDAIDQRAYSSEVIQSAIQGLREASERSARAATANLVAFLNENADNYPLWRDSSANKMTANSTIVTSEFGGVFL